MHNVLVTGGSRGLGLGIAETLAASGFQVIAVARRDGDTLQAAQARVAAEARGALHFRAFDLAEIAGISGFVKQLHREFGAFHGLVNNAALGTGGILANMPDSTIEQLIRLNVVSPLTLTKYLVRSMMTAQGMTAQGMTAQGMTAQGMTAQGMTAQGMTAQGMTAQGMTAQGGMTGPGGVSGPGGRIVNVSSVVGTTGYSGLSVYSATKASLLGFTRSLARELGPLGISVNAIAPGFVDTEMTHELTPAQRTQIAHRSALRRMPEIADIANAVDFLFSEKARNVTGTVLTVDAGNTA